MKKPRVHPDTKETSDGGFINHYSFTLSFNSNVERIFSMSIVFTPSAVKTYKVEPIGKL